MLKKKNTSSTKPNLNDPTELAMSLKEEGNKLYMEEKFEKAIDYYSEAIKLDHQNPIFYSNRSACYLAIGEYPSALADALISIELDDKFIKGYFRAALCYFYMNEYEKAIETIDKCDLGKEEKELINLKEIIQSKVKEEEYNKNNFPSYSKFKTFFTWLDEGRVSYPKLELKFFSDDHRGIYAKNKVQKDELIVKIPVNMLITLELAKESPIGIKMLNSNLDLLSPKHCFLSSFLLQEKQKEDTPWKKYLDILPKSYDNFPIFFTDEEKKWLIGSPFLSLVNEKIKDIETDYNMIVEVAPEFEKNFTMKEFSEMRMAVSSRIFGIKINGRKTDCFAPLADMLNHKRPRQTQWFYSDDLKSFVIQSLLDIEKGEQVFDSYGKKCNSRFLLNYGFIVEHNDGNEYPLTIELTSKDPLYPYKINFLLPSKELKKTFRVQTNFNEQVNTDFFSYLRFKCFDGDINNLINLMVLKKNSDGESDYYSKSSFNSIPPICIKNELSVLSEIERLTEDHLSRYETDFEMDLEILQNNDKLSNNQKNCLMMRMGEKKILIFFQHFAKYATSLFDLTSKEIKKKIKKDFPLQCPYENYINDVVLHLIRMESSK